MKNTLAIFVAVLIFTASSARGDSWTALNYPGASDTYVEGISGNNIVGYYNDPGRFGQTHGFIYNGISWTSLNAPGATDDTRAYGIDGINIVGTSNRGGFIYNGTTWAFPDVGEITDISGNKLVGYYLTSSPDHSFLYDITSQIRTTIDPPGATNSGANGISGNNIVGVYGDALDIPHSFLYSAANQTWSTIDMPGAKYTYMYGIDGDHIVGCYSNDTGRAHGFLYDLTTQSWTTIDYPGAYDTYVTGIDGNKLVGYYDNNGPAYYGFVYEIPEPVSALLIGFGALFLTSRRKRSYPEIRISDVVMPQSYAA